MKKATNEVFLTIAIPTYNRLDCLKLLLESLLNDIPSNVILGEEIEILICNNASTDDTKKYLDSMEEKNNIRSVHHEINCGGDSNITYCCGAALGKYLWIIGDDDLPMSGAILPLLNFLKTNEPDMLYLPASWKAGELDPYCGTAVTNVEFSSASKLELAALANIYITFISSWVMNIETYKSHVGFLEYNRYEGTSLSQLEWILTILSKGNKFFYANTNWLFARSGNSGNYSLFEVFSENYNKIIKDKFSKNDELYHFFISCMLWCFFPGVIWDVRKSSAGNFEAFDKIKVAEILKRAYGNDIFFISLVLPIINCNIWLAGNFRYVTRVFAKLWLYKCKKIGEKK